MRAAAVRDRSGRSPLVEAGVVGHSFVDYTETNYYRQSTAELAED